MNMLPKYASVSFGKDSTCMLLLLIEKKCPPDEVVFFNNGVEYQAIYHVRDMLVPYIESQGICYTELHPEKPFLWNMLERPVCKRGTNTIHKYGYSWCGGTCRWETSMKLTALKKHTSKGRDYVGLAANETQRFAKENRPNRLLPLVEWGMTEKDTLAYCYSMGIHWEEDGIRLYDLLDRVSCWCCGNKNLKELRNMFLYMPDYWEKLKQLQQKTPFPFRRNEKLTIFDLEERFRKEQKGKAIFPQPFISSGKGNSVSLLSCKVGALRVCEKISAPSLRFGQYFSDKTLHDRDTELRKAR